MKFEIEVEPLPQSRPRFTRGKVYELPKMKAYKSSVALAALVAMQGKEPIENPVSCKIKLWRKYKPTSKRYGDFDNHAKSICDALNKIVWIDDSQIISCTVEKYQSATPKVEVEVNEVSAGS